MKTLSLPTREYIDILQAQSPLAEQAGCFTTEQLNIIYKEKWFNIYVPQSFGGLGLEFPEAIQLLEHFAWIDGSLGWAVTLGSGANLFIGYLHSNIVSLFFNDPQVCLAGSGASTGKAERADGGYIINGKWKYATGSAHATAFTANCILADNTTGSFIFKADEVAIEYDWNSMGMKATGSHSFVVKDLFVPNERLFYIDAAHAVLPDAIFYFPFMQFAEATLAANIAGMAGHFTDECRRIFEDRIRNKTLAVEQSSEMLEFLGRSISIIEKNRDVFYDALCELWHLGKHEKNWDIYLLNRLSFASKKMVRELLRIVSQLYPYCGMEGADQGSTLNRIWRDIHTASQHQLITFKQPISANI
ncbi:MAG: acyl-CoA dehydrogenase [Chitinophagaceae bacterium]|nr:acyl-CoA dehydrogenase [Chitinophagaceae bacterium]